MSGCVSRRGTAAIECLLEFAAESYSPEPLFSLKLKPETLSKSLFSFALFSVFRTDFWYLM